MAPPPAVTGAACLLPCRLPAPATQLAAHLAAHLALHTDGLGEVEPSGEADEFFHFVLLCFGIGALLVSYHYYADWFMSLGVGLLTFASLETVGIYFGLVYRIHSVLRGFLPLFQKFRQLGFYMGGTSSGLAQAPKNRISAGYQDAPRCWAWCLSLQKVCPTATGLCPPHPPWLLQNTLQADSLFALAAATGLLRPASSSAKTG
ncbi:Transmembrane protein 40 [Fukomys damarensis]|uniref:Transmembrane protein 40 n=1 Tax=Fukomys damarensis TaxID=885580 RepID=A0A091D5R7_FUKDA|nr:Transmembrane protein 40 [Fukomys damarensis]